MRASICVCVLLIACRPSQSATVGDTDRYLPVIHDGGEWRTSISVVNLGDEPAKIVVTF